MIVELQEIMNWEDYQFADLREDKRGPSQLSGALNASVFEGL